MKHLILFLGFVAVTLPVRTIIAADWPQWGGSPLRNNTPDGDNIPVEWNVGQFDYRTKRWLGESAENVRWVARLGTQSYGSPVVANQHVFCATNNGAAYLQRYPEDVDLGCLLCFDRTDGHLKWLLAREKLAAGKEVDWPDQGICCSPLVEDDRLWLVTNRGEVVCLDAEGFQDGQNDGPYTSEPNTNRDEADVVWLFDMMGQLGVVQHNMASCSVTAAGDLLLVCTSNGRDDTAPSMPAPEAPSFLALDKRTGKLLWADASPGGNVLHGQWASPAFAVFDNVPQALFPGGDGWLYSFRAEETDDGKPELLWKFDCNPKQSKWASGGRGDRNNIIATPVVYEGRVYLATGQDPEHGEGRGHLWCIDPTRQGDVSPELVVDRDGNSVVPRRECAVAEDAGEEVVANPNSAAIWVYTGTDLDGDGELSYEETMHRTLSMPAIKEDLLVIPDIAGVVHCLDAKTGKPHWTHDMLAAVWGSPLLVEGKIYLGDEDGEVAVLALSAEKKLLAENYMEAPVYSAPVVADNVLYISTRTHLFAITAE